MIESQTLLAFIKMHEAKLRAKIYAHKYERLSKLDAPNIELEDEETSYNYDIADDDDEDWLDREEPNLAIHGGKALNFYK